MCVARNKKVSAGPLGRAIVNLWGCTLKHFPEWFILLPKQFLSWWQLQGNCCASMHRGSPPFPLKKNVWVFPRSQSSHLLLSLPFRDDSAMVVADDVDDVHYVFGKRHGCDHSSGDKSRHWIYGIFRQENVITFVQRPLFVLTFRTRFYY